MVNVTYCQVFYQQNGQLKLRLCCRGIMSKYFTLVISQTIPFVYHHQLIMSASRCCKLVFNTPLPIIAHHLH